MRTTAVALLAGALLLAGCSGDDDGMGGGCSQLDSGSTGFGAGSPDAAPGNFVIRTDAEYDAIFPFPCIDSPCPLPPRPSAGQAVLVARRAWSGCGSCATISCVRREGTALVAIVQVHHGDPNCDSYGVTEGWALIEDDGSTVIFEDGPPLDGAAGCL